MRIDQWVPTLHRGDAIGDSARLMRDAFRSWGHTADVYALELDPDLDGDGRRFADWSPGRPADVVILHYALPSPLTRRAPRPPRAPGAAPPQHHPPRVLRGLGSGDGPHLHPRARGARHASRPTWTWASPTASSTVSSWRPSASVAPESCPSTSTSAGTASRRSPVLRRLLDDGRTNLLFVGRLAPNKRPEDLVRLASYWKRFVSPDVRLVLVGKPPRRLAYFDALQALAYEEGFTPWEVVFLGHVPHEDLLACYSTASLFVSMSEHEGFGVPLVESMLMGVPVLAYAATAVPHTLGGAGVQFAEKRFPEIAELGHALVTDRRLRAEVLAGQERRLAAFAPDAVEGTLRRYVDSL